MTVNSRDIVRLIKLKHSKKALVVEECKTGSSWSSHTCPRLDVWVLIKSWAHFKTIGYEIKVSRADFLGDNKFHKYLDYCHEFYFVCPQGIIDRSEVPEGCGLIWASKNAKVLYTKKRAAFRDIEIPVSLYLYILMSRVNVGREYGPDRERSIEYWRDWLSQKQDAYNIGHSVSKKLRSAIRENIDIVKKENNKLQCQIEHLREIKRYCDENHIDYSSWFGVREERKINEINERARSGIIPEISKNIDRLINKLENTKKEVSELTG